MIYYIAANGSDSNNGTSPSSPWQTIGKVNSSQGSFLPGDSIYFRAGDTFVGNLLITTGGTFLNAITYSVYGASPATIAPASGSGIEGLDVGYVAVSNLTIVGTNQTPDSNVLPAGILVQNDTGGTTKYAGISLVNNTITGFPSGIFIRTVSGAGSGYDGTTISGNTVHDCNACLIQLWGPDVTRTGCFTNVKISGNTLYNSPGNGTRTSGIGIALGFATTGIVCNNLVHNVGYGATNSGGGPGGIVAVYCDSITIERNEVYDVFETAAHVDGVGIDCDTLTTNCLVQYNYTHDCEGAGFYDFNVSGGNTYRYNISVNDAHGQGGMSAFQSFALVNLTLHNNTIIIYSGVRGSTACISLDEDTSTVSGTNYCCNNIMMVLVAEGLLTFVTQSITGLVMEGNVYYSFNVATGGGDALLFYNGTFYFTLDAFRTASGQENFGGVARGSMAAPVFASPPANASQIPADVNMLTFNAFQPSNALLAGTTAIDLRSAYGLTLPDTDFSGSPIPTTNALPGAYANAAGLVSMAVSTPWNTTGQTMTVEVVTAGTQVAIGPLSDGVTEFPAGSAHYNSTIGNVDPASAGQIVWNDGGSGPTHFVVQSFGPVRATDTGGSALATSAQAMGIVTQTNKIGTNAGDSPNAIVAQTKVGNIGIVVTGIASGETVVNANVTGVNGVAFGGFAIPVVVTVLPYVSGTVPANQTPALSGNNLDSAINYPFARAFTVNSIDASAWTQVVFTVKSKNTDADSAAIITVKVTNPGNGSDGLILLNGAAPSGSTTAADGSITVTSATTAGIAFNVALTARGMALSAAGSFVWEVTLYLGGNKGTWLGGGQFAVEQTVRVNPVAS